MELINRQIDTEFGRQNEVGSLGGQNNTENGVNLDTKMEEKPKVRHKLIQHTQQNSRFGEIGRKRAIDFKRVAPKESKSTEQMKLNGSARATVPRFDVWSPFDV